MDNRKIESHEDLFDQKPLENPRIPFRDLRIKNPVLVSKLLKAVEDVLVHGPIIAGKRVELFERNLSVYCGRSCCVGVSSGTDALFLALKVYGIGESDEVITTAMSWVATANAIAMTGATPVFVDVRWDQNIDPKRIEEAISPRTKAIVPVHFTGRLCDMRAIRGIADKYKLILIEDAAQALGAEKDGYRAGSLGDAAAFSLNPMKVFPGYGEAGAIVTDQVDKADRLRALRYLGTEQKEICVTPFSNAKMDEIQAAMLNLGFDAIDEIVTKRIEMANSYTQALSDVVDCPPDSDGKNRSSNYFDYVILADRRDMLRKWLRDNNIETKVKHPLLLPDHPAYQYLSRPELPVSDEIVGKKISLPLYEGLDGSKIEFVANHIREFVER